MPNTIPFPGSSDTLVDRYVESLYDQADIAAERARQAACVTRGGLDREAVALVAMYSERANSRFADALIADTLRGLCPEVTAPTDLSTWWDRRNASTAADLDRAQVAA